MRVLMIVFFDREFGEPCVFVVQRLRSQIIEWSNYKYCGFKCLYKVYSFDYDYGID